MPGKPKRKNTFDEKMAEDNLNYSEKKTAKINKYNIGNVEDLLTKLKTQSTPELFDRLNEIIPGSVNKLDLGDKGVAFQKNNTVIRDFLKNLKDI